LTIDRKFVLLSNTPLLGPVIGKPQFPVHLHVESVQVRYRCPCCGRKTLEAPGALVLCPVCWWEDDGQEDADANEIRHTVNGSLSLSEARENYTRFGAADPCFLPHVRKPRVTEE